MRGYFVPVCLQVLSTFFTQVGKMFFTSAGDSCRAHAYDGFTGAVYEYTERSFMWMRIGLDAYKQFFAQNGKITIPVYPA